MSMKLGDMAPTVGRETHRKPLDNLTLDSIAAERAGMSYGAYKAKNPNTYAAREAAGVFNKKKPRKQGYDLICARCGGHFIGKSKDKRYCSDLCRAAVNNKNYRDKQKAQKEVPADEIII